MPRPKVEVYATLPITVTVLVDGNLASVGTLDRPLHFRVHLTERVLRDTESLDKALDAEMRGVRHDLAALVKGTCEYTSAADNSWWPAVVALVRRMVRQHA